MKVYLDGYLLDTDNTTLSLTYNFNNTLSGNENSISHSNQIKLPQTKRNRAFFQYFQGTRFKPKLYQCTVVNPRSGLTIFFGFAYRVNTDKDGLSLELYNSPIDFFDSIDPLNLSDLNFTSTITWDQTTATAARNATSGLVAPVIDYGQIDPDTSIPQLFRAPVSPFNVINYPPSVYFKTVLEKIFSDQGYSLGTFDDVRYDKLIIPYGLETWPGASFKIKDILPDMTQKDFIAQFQSTFGVKLMQTDPTLTFKVKSINDVFNNGYYDWTRKFNGLYIDEADTTLAQNSIFKWGNTSLHSGVVSINNRYLKKFDNLFESKFEDNGKETYQISNVPENLYGWQYKLWNNLDSAAGGMYRFYVASSANNASGFVQIQINGFDIRPFYSIGDSVHVSGGSYNHNGKVTEISFSGGNSFIYTSIAYINNTATGISNTTKEPFDITPKPSLALVRDPIAGVEPAQIFFANNTYSDYLVGYRYANYDGNQPPIPWLAKASQLVGSYGANFGFKQERYYNLNDIDILNMLFNEKLIIDRNELFLVNSIIDYVPNQLTRVQMLKVL